MSLVRIARVSNYDCEMYEEKFVENIPELPLEQAWKICRVLNDINPDGPDYYKPVSINYTLYKFEP